MAAPHRLSLLKIRRISYQECESRTCPEHLAPLLAARGRQRPTQEMGESPGCRKAPKGRPKESSV